MINLIIPPVSDCFMPTLGAAQLAGYLKKNDIKCRLYDASAEFFYNLFRSDIQQSEYQKFTFKGLCACLDRFSANFEELDIKIDGFETNFSWKDEERVSKYIDEESVFTRELEKLSLVCEKENDTGEQKYYGFSISYECQVIPALLLAKIIKKKRRDAKICIGGSLLYNYENDFYKLFYASELIDILIVGAGEEVLKYIGLGELKNLKKLVGIKISVIQDRYIIDTRGLKSNPIVYEPDFSDICFEYYPSDEKAFPYMIKDRCYYGKCCFCNGDRVGEQKIVKNITTAFRFIEKIAVNIGIKNVYIVDAALSPKDFKEISGLMTGPTISWIANGRFEKQLRDEKLISKLSEKGCVMLRFGLESASPKVLDLMNKGVDISVAEDILNMTARYGIKNHVYLMFGYPGETRADRKMTLDFLERNKAVISSYSVSVFQPVPGTKVYQELLEEAGEWGNAYDRIMDRLYPEAHYNEIYEDISSLNNLLRGYVRTNLEYYSANIFNTAYGDEEEKHFSGKDILTAEEKVNIEMSIQFSPKKNDG